MKVSQAAGLVFVAFLGVVLGLGVYTFAYAKGWSYLTNDPNACANCHVMNEQFDGWAKASHRSVAVCNDCHVPHDTIGKYTTKARNGFWHSFYFTTQTFAEPIRATGASRGIAEANCRRCHETVTLGLNARSHEGPEGLSCIRCHASVGHLELGATSLAAETR